MNHFVLGTDDLVDEDGEPMGYFWIEPAAEDQPWPWLHGERFDSPPREPVALRVRWDDDEAGAFADYVSGAVPIVTVALRRALERAGVDNVEFFPVQIEGAERFDEFPEYFAINVVGLVSVAGPGSQLRRTFGTGGADIIDKIEPNAAASGDLKCFRVAEHLATIVVSDDVRRTCEREGIETLRFTPLEQWRT